MKPLLKSLDQKKLPIKANQFDTNAGYCFINEQDLLSQLINVSGIILRHLIIAIRQVENIGLVYALVKDTACNSLNKCYDFIFDNPLSDEALIS